MSNKRYQEHRGDILVDPGIHTLLAVREYIASLDADLLFTAGNAIDGACQLRGCVDSWDVLNSLDYWAEKGVIKWMNHPANPIGQDRVYLKRKPSPAPPSQGESDGN